MGRTCVDGEPDRWVPLSIALWYRRVNLCIPKRGDERPRLEQRDGRPLIGPDGSIATNAVCAEASGRFLPARFSWMVHVAVFGDDGPVWGEHYSRQRRAGCAGRQRTTGAIMRSFRTLRAV